MKPLIESLREILGPADFFIEGAWDYGAMIEYFVAAVILTVVVTSVFRFIVKVVT